MSNEELEQPVDGEKSEEFEAVETGASKERTRESEIQANIDFWKDLAIEGIEVDEDEIRSAIEALPEKKGFNWDLVIPKDLKMSDLWHKMTERYKDLTPMTKDTGGNPITQDIDFMSRRPVKETYAVAARNSQEPDQDSLGETTRTPLQWAETGRDFMSITELAVADLRWNAENGGHITSTLCPAPRNVVHDPYRLEFSGDKFGILYHNPGHKGVIREVITKDTKVEE